MVRFSNSITRTLIEIATVGYSTRHPFCIGHNERRLYLYALKHGIDIAHGGVYTSPKALSHMTRKIKHKNGVVVSNEKISMFPRMRSKYDLFYDKYSGIFVYIDGEQNKYVIHPSYQLTIRNRKYRKNVFITASKFKSVENFYRDTKRYDKIKKRKGD